VPYFAGSDNTRVAQADNTWLDRAGTEVVKLVEGQVGTMQEEVGRMDIGTLRTHQGGRSRSWKGEGEVGEVGARNIHSGLVSIHERHEGAVAKVVQGAWPSTGVGVGTGRIHPSRSYAHTLVRILHWCWNPGLSCLGNPHARNSRVHNFRARALRWTMVAVVDPGCLRHSPALDPPCDFAPGPFVVP